jgi:hypothetical protein
MVYVFQFSARNVLFYIFIMVSRFGQNDFVSIMFADFVEINHANFVEIKRLVLIVDFTEIVSRSNKS